MANGAEDKLHYLLLDWFIQKRWKKLLWVLAGLAALVWVVYAVRSIWLPLGVAFLIALVLDPVVDRLEARGWSRLLGAAVIFASFLLVVAAILWFAVPAVAEQARTLGARVEQYLPDRSAEGIERSLREYKVSPTIRPLLVRAIEGTDRAIDRSFTWLSEHAMEVGTNLVWLVIIPIVAFYALKDFHLILAKGLLLVPRQKRDFVQTLVAEITAVFAKYMRGLAVVSLLNGLATWLLLMVLGVPGSFMLGLFAGVVYGVPYLGALTTIAVIAVVSFVTNGFEFMLLVVGLNVLLHQVIFDQIVTPRVVGGHVGLHPIWAIVALLIGNSLLGLIGMLLAMPVAACIQIAVVALVPKLSHEIDLDPNSDEHLKEATVEQHLQSDATQELHQAVSDAVENIEAKADAAE